MFIILILSQIVVNGTQLCKTNQAKFIEIIPNLKYRYGKKKQGNAFIGS